MATANRPERFDLFTLQSGQRKVTYEAEQNVADAGTFHILKEDHTLGNLLRMQLLRDQQVLFAGYKVPHPLETEVVLKVRTSTTHNPIARVHAAFECLKNEVESLQKQFEVCIFEVYDSI